MKRLHQIRIKNFKAFQETQTIDIKGKNILIYGNNGSGKSSLFWALYTFLQSSIKADADIQKYFEKFVESNKSTHQGLLNVFTDGDSFIELTTIDDDEKKDVYKISHETINTNKDSDTIIQELNQASDFINYKLLHNFYNVSHRREVNLWPVFERDIFPFLMDDANHVMLDKIKEKTSDVDRTAKGRVVTQRKKEANIQELDSINTEIESLLSQIQTNANDFLKKHFFENKEVIRIKLEFIKKFKFEEVKSKFWESGKDAERHSKLQIKLVAEIFENATGNWKPIHRVQSFLHESQLTRIAISIRIGALRTRVQTTDFKILVLDDMLISLDMSNRMKVVKMILNKDNDPDLRFFDEFQKIILTHDKGFYELVKRHTSPHQWEYYNFYSSEEGNHPPKVKIDRTSLEKAEAFLVDGEFDACGNELRKETETLLDKYLRGLSSAAEYGEFEPLASNLNQALKRMTETRRKDFNKVFVNKNLSTELIKKIKSDYSNDSSLTPNEKGKLTGLKNELMNYLIKQYELKEGTEKIIEETQDILIRIMNPASHASLVPLYESELKKAIDGVKVLKEHLDNRG